jgi:hypothetical protein
MRPTKFAPEGYTNLCDAVLKLTFATAEEFLELVTASDEEDPNSEEREIRGQLLLIAARLREAEAMNTLRRALSSSQLQAFYIGARGHIHPLKPHFWNSKSGEIIFAPGADCSSLAWLPEWGEDGPPVAVLLPADEFEAWRGSPQPAANGPCRRAPPGCQK